MENLLSYIIQVNLLLTLIFLGYHLLLKGLTFYVLNRIYFVVGALYAFIFPLIDLKSFFVKQTIVSIPVVWDYVPLDNVEHLSKTYSLYDILLVGITIGGLIFICKLVLQLFSLLRIHFYSKEAQWQSYWFRNVVFPIVPFSFFNKIYLHQIQHQDVELNDIFEHEMVHVKGRHTWDILLFEILLIGCWYNPFVWLMRRAVNQNLEFLTDQQVLNNGVDRQSYQYSLLNVTKHGTAVGISNQFNFKTLKKRIMMMNKKRSSRLALSKYVFLLPILLLAGATFTLSQAESRIEHVVELVKETPTFVKPISMFDSTQINSKEYPLLALDFDKENVAKLNNYYEIDGKLVSLDDFLAFPRAEISGVDIYKDKVEIQRKIGKPNADALFVMTSKQRAGFSDKSVIKTNQQEEDFKRLKSKNEVDNKKTYLYDYDGNILPKADFFAIADDNLKNLTLISNKSILSGKYGKHVDDIGNYDGVIRAYSVEGERKNQERIMNALYVLDGVEKDKSFDLNSLNPNDIKSVTVLKDSAVVDRYGDKGKNGVIIIETKSHAVSRLSKEMSADQEITDVAYKGRSETVAILSKPDVQKMDGVFIPKQRKSVEKIVLRANPSSEPPLFVVDGIEKDENFNLKSLNPNDIESITVLKDKASDSKYGDKGKNGVIIIDLKK